jgi:hypothetical protein
MRGHWAAAAKAYSRLAKNDTLSNEHRGFALFRLSYSLNEFALSLRVAAIQKRSSEDATASEYFDQCWEWLLKSVDFCKSSVEIVGFPAQYNVACCYSTLAQLAVERRLNAKMALKLSSNEAADEVWSQDIGPFWRDAVESDRSTREKYFKMPFDPSEVDSWAKKALVSIKAPPTPGTMEGRFQPDQDFFRRFARRDADLLFLRADSVYSIHFNSWLDGGEAKDWLLLTSKMLREDV